MDAQRKTPRTTHSNVVVPLICAAMDVGHPAIASMRQEFGGEKLAGAVADIRSILPLLSTGTPHIDVTGPYPYVSITDQEAILELAFVIFEGTGAFQEIQTVVAMRQAIAHETATTRLPLARSLSLVTCCDAPQDATCKVTGLAHQPAKCATCNHTMNPLQPFCSRETPGSMVKCSPAARPPVRSSPFTEISHDNLSALHEMQSAAELQRKKIAHEAMLKELLGSVGTAEDEEENPPKHSKSK